MTQLRNCLEAKGSNGSNAGIAVVPPFPQPDLAKALPATMWCEHQRPVVLAIGVQQPQVEAHQHLNQQGPPAWNLLATLHPICSTMRNAKPRISEGWAPKELANATWRASLFCSAHSRLLPQRTKGTMSPKALLPSRFPKVKYPRDSGNLTPQSGLF